ncbi:MAG: hypothetical protein AMJ79_05465 [Phycisphaerae bacterium SM23_30]|nr:MAG: hypothetical protein AMJ79_05465 [Phycisphaerae bacterium SM23_30]
MWPVINNENKSYLVKVRFVLIGYKLGKDDDKTSLGGSNVQFPTTEWTKITDKHLSKAVLSELSEKYWRPLYLHLRRKGFNNEDAKDLVQSFFSEKVLGQELIKKADKSRGKFRTFLLVSLNNYVIDLYRGKPSPPQEVIPELNGGIDPESEFERDWAEGLLHESLLELKEECFRCDKIAHWELFRCWLLEPDLNSNKMSMKTICAKNGIENADRAYNMISNTKGRFRKILRRRLKPLVDSDVEIDTEISHFINIFSSNPTR